MNGFTVSASAGFFAHSTVHPSGIAGLLLKIPQARQYPKNTAFALVLWLHNGDGSWHLQLAPHQLRETCCIAHSTLCIYPEWQALLPKILQAKQYPKNGLIKILNLFGFTMEIELRRCGLHQMRWHLPIASDAVLPKPCKRNNIQRMA